MKICELETAKDQLGPNFQDFIFLYNYHLAEINEHVEFLNKIEMESKARSESRLPSTRSIPTIKQQDSLLETPGFTPSKNTLPDLSFSQTHVSTVDHNSLVSMIYVQEK